MRNKKKPKKNQKPLGFKIFKIVSLTILILILVLGVAGLGVGYAMIKTAPELDVNKILTLNEPARFYDDKGNLVDEYTTMEKREFVTIDKIPEHLQEAFISIEDERFETHQGVDLYRFMGAMKNNVLTLFNGKGDIQGASTITQQLVKQKMFLNSSLEDRLNIERKVQEMYLAYKLEKVLSKDKILETYMNTIFLGGTAYGIKAAANQYFGKNLDELTLSECAFLASAAQNPTLSQMLSFEAFKENKPFSSERSLAVLRKMLERGKITEKEYNDATKDKIIYADGSGTTESYNDTLNISFNYKKGNINKMNYEWFSRAVIDEIIKDLKAKNRSEAEIHSMLANGGLKIYTTMNTELQNKTQEILNDETSPDKPYAYQYLFPRDGELNPLQPDLQASATVIDYHTGEVKVIVGGRGEQGPLSFNRAVSHDFLRPPGSTIKPLTVFAPAIESKHFTAGSGIEDSPIPSEIGSKYAGPGQEPYNPGNAGRGYIGYCNLRKGLQQSYNTTPVKILDKIGLNTSADYGEKFGLIIDESDKHSMAALALGQLNGNTSGTTPLMLANAFGTFGNNGLITKPRLYTKVVDKTGKTILETKFEAEQIISPQTAYIMYDLLKEPIWNGTGTMAYMENMSVRGKTGTSSDGKDYTFAGITPYYAGAVWVGNDDNTEVDNNWGNFGSNSVGKIWKTIMEEFHEGLEDKAIEQPSGIVRVPICRDSGLLADKYCKLDPRGDRTYTELFIEGTAPSTFCDLHVEAEVVKKPKDDKHPEERYVLATEFSDKSKVEKRVFIKREKPNSSLGDHKFVLPTEKDDAKKPEEKPKDPFDELLDLWDKRKNKDKNKDTDTDNNKDNTSNTDDKTSDNNDESIKEEESDNKNKEKNTEDTDLDEIIDFND